VSGEQDQSEAATVASINAPAGAAASSAAIPPTVVIVPIAPVAQPRLSSKTPQKRADTGLHVGHEEVHRLQRSAITGTHGRRRHVLLNHNSRYRAGGGGGAG
jgi:hypothetical protein